MDFHASRFDRTGELMDWLRHYPRGREKVLLREPEVCRECTRTYLSLYPLRVCSDHDGLEKG
ncbi:MAG: hypothetical protein HY883_04775 [Deltaproteobacteria bacterium]|nr:hypothetical protein [Deltaproteobacteria bacterium]